METTQIDVPWQALLEDPRFADLPFKLETNVRGQIILSPHRYKHSKKQYRIGRLIEEHAERAGLEGDCSVEVAVATSQGLRTVDVGWMASEREAEVERRFGLDVFPFPIAPDVCVEVISPSNTAEEMIGTRALYFERGAREVWVVEEAGQVLFYDANGKRAASALMPSFPGRLKP